MNMASLKGFYETVSTSEDSDSRTVEVQLNAAHDVYEGHFPGRPVAPGAALTQMVLDELAKITGNRPVKELRQVKFLTVIDPMQVNGLTLEYRFRERDGVEMFTCVGRSEETAYIKLNGIFG